MGQRLKKLLGLDRYGPVRIVLRRIRKDYVKPLEFAASLRLSALRRRRSKATFIGVTGSSGKSTAVALLAHLLEGHGSLRAQINYNLIGNLFATLRGLPRSLDYVVVETAAIARGQLKQLAGILKPDVAIVTMVGIEHYTAFRSHEAVAEEKGRLVEAVRPGGFALLNADDALVAGMRARTRERVVTFGRGEGADYRVVSVAARFPASLTVEIEWRGGRLALATPLVGEHFWLSVTAAVAAALELGVPAGTIVERAASFRGMHGRCEFYGIDGGPQFVVDTFKAPNETLGLAFGVLENVEAPRRRTVLGHISDFAGNPKPKYRDAYRAARAVSDEVIFVGEHAHRSQASEEDRRTGRFIGFTGPLQVYKHVRATAVPGEVILLKSSRNLHLERVALAFDHEVKCWVPTCGVWMDCVTCGLFEHPFEEHAGIHSRRRRAKILARLRFWRREK
jgi:UDP-N-acetylmuramoyl-tripeptide--D-alanyl-D-alanine ligase